MEGSVIIWGPPFSFEAQAVARASNEKGGPSNEKAEPQIITEPDMWCLLLLLIISCSTIFYTNLKFYKIIIQWIETT